MKRFGTGVRRFNSTMELECHLMALQDLVTAKKTQRDKDWPMIRRLVEADYFANRAKSEGNQIEFWLREMRTPELLIEVATSHPEKVSRLIEERPLLKHAVSSDVEKLAETMLVEEAEERESDKAYWKPLRAELERLRHERIRGLS